MSKELIEILLDYANDEDFEEFENHKEYFDNAFWYFKDEDILVFECIYKDLSTFISGAFKFAFKIVNNCRYHLYKEDEREEAEEIEKGVENEIDEYDCYYPFPLTTELKNLGYISLIYNMNY